MITRQCPICSSSNYQVIFHDHNRREDLRLEADFVKCRSCGMKYLTNLPGFDEVKSNYQEIYYHQLFSLPKKEIKMNGKKILDVGCNFGGQLKKYYLAGYEIYGLDLNADAIDDARKNLPNGNFKVSTVEDSKYFDNYFDVIRSSHVLEHVYDVASFVKEVYRILKPGGKFLIYVPNGNSLEMKIFGKYSSQSWVPFHVNLFGGKQLAKTLSELGFKDIKFKTRPMPWWWILSWRQFRSRISIGGSKTDFSRSALDKLLMIILYIPLFIISKFGLGEELLIAAKK